MSAIGLFFLLTLAGCASRQGSAPDSTTQARPITPADFARADVFLDETQEARLWNGDIGFQWIDGHTLLYKHQSIDGVRYLMIDAGTGEKALAFDHREMAEAISSATSVEADPHALPISSLHQLDKNVFAVTIDAGSTQLECDLENSSCVPIDTEAPNAPVAVPSPSGNHGVIARDHDLALLDLESGDIQLITDDGSEYWAYGAYPESSTFEVTARRMGLELPPLVSWSPDGKKFVGYRLDERHVSAFTLLQSVPEDGAFRPRTHTFRMDLPGEHPPEATYFIYDVERNERVDVNYLPIPSTYSVPFAHHNATLWSGDSRKFFLLDDRTDLQRMRLVEVDTTTGAARILIDEVVDTFPDPAAIGKRVSLLANGDIIWHSERSGWGHLYLHDGNTGAIKNSITSGQWTVRDLIRVDDSAGLVYFTASGRETGEDIYFRRLYRAKIDGSDIELLTPESAEHEIWSEVSSVVRLLNNYMVGAQPAASFSPDGGYFVDRHGAPDDPGGWSLRRADGELVAELARVETRGLPPFTMPEPFSVKSADGGYDLYGVLFKPSDFDAAKKYPVIDNIYPGPQAIRSPKAFEIFEMSQALAELGFIVVTVDGRGTPLRSKAFRDHVYGRMETAGMLDDHVAAIRQLDQSRPYLDLDRVGIYGTSGGGFATGHALIRYPDFFKVGVASAGNHEQRLYMRDWGEAFHGPLEAADYDRVFAGQDVARFEGKLLLAHGDMDDNVHIAHTMRLVDALIKGGKDFDLLIMPNVNHDIRMNPYFRRKLQRYFLVHLMGAKIETSADMGISR